MSESLNQQEREQQNSLGTPVMYLGCEKPQSQNVVIPSLLM